MEKKHVFIELVSYENEDNKNDPLNGHNYIYDAKNLPDNFYKEYHPVKGSKGSLKNITVDQIYNIKREPRYLYTVWEWLCYCFKTSFNNGWE